jgi:hypothetical protein
MPTVMSCRGAYGQLPPNILKEVGEIPESNFELGRDPVSQRKHPGNFSVAESLRARANPLLNKTSSLMLALLASRNIMSIVRLKRMRDG